MKIKIVGCLVLLLSLFTSRSFAQSCTGGAGKDFFTGCQAGTSYTLTGNYTMNIGQNESININGNVTINGTLTINFTGNTSLLHIATGFTLQATNVTINNSNPAKVMDIDGAFIVTNTLDFNGENIDIDGTGTIDAGTITGAGNVTCALEGDCPDIHSPNPCSPAGAGLCGEGVVLPVTLIYFSASQAYESVALNWATSMEKNFNFFVVERSQDGREFSEIGQVGGSGNSLQRKDYNFDDRFPLQGRSYYKLTAVDYDGFTEQLSVATLDYSGAKTARAFPNPAAEGKFNLELSFTPTDQIHVAVTDLTGMAVGNFSTMESRILVQLHSGTYLVKLSSSEFNKVLRVVVP
jgi:hypothetical protein